MDWTQIEQQAHMMFLASYELEHKPPKPRKVKLPTIHIIVIVVGVLLSILQGFRTFDVFFKIGLSSAYSNEIVMSMLGTTFATLFGVAEGLVAFLAIELLLAVLPFLGGIQTKSFDIRQKLLFPAVVGFILTILAGFIQAAAVSPALKTAASITTTILVLLLSFGVTAMTYTTWHLAGQILSMFRKQQEEAEKAFREEMQTYLNTRAQVWSKTKHLWMQRAQATYGGERAERRSQKALSYKLTANEVEEALQTYIASHRKTPTAVELLTFILKSGNVPLQDDEEKHLFVRLNKGWVHNLIQRRTRNHGG